MRKFLYSLPLVFLFACTQNNETPIINHQNTNEIKTEEPTKRFLQSDDKKLQVWIRDYPGDQDDQFKLFNHNGETAQEIVVAEITAPGLDFNAAVEAGDAFISSNGENVPDTSKLFAEPAGNTLEIGN